MNYMYYICATVINMCKHKFFCSGNYLLMGIGRRVSLANDMYCDCDADKLVLIALPLSVRYFLTLPLVMPPLLID